MVSAAVPEPTQSALRGLGSGPAVVTLPGRNNTRPFASRVLPTTAPLAAAGMAGLSSWAWSCNWP